MDKVKVSERAVLQRLNRALKASGRAVKQSRESTRTRAEFGRFYVVDKSSVVAKSIDLITWAREAQVVEEYEEIGDFESFKECRIALLDSLVRMRRGTMPGIDSTAVRRDAASFNRRARGEVRAMRAAVNLEKALNVNAALASV